MSVYWDTIRQIESKQYKPKSPEEFVDLYMNTYLENEQHLTVNLKVDLMYLFAHKCGLKYSDRIIRAAVNVWNYLNIKKPIIESEVDTWLSQMSMYPNKAKGKYAKEYYTEWLLWAKQNGYNDLDFRKEWLDLFRKHKRVVQSEKLYHMGYRYKILDKDCI